MEDRVITFKNLHREQVDLLCVATKEEVKEIIRAFHVTVGKIPNLPKSLTSLTDGEVVARYVSVEEPESDLGALIGELDLEQFKSERLLSLVRHQKKVMDWDNSQTRRNK